jgi:hypothetical protein
MMISLNFVIFWERGRGPRSTGTAGCTAHHGGGGWSDWDTSPHAPADWLMCSAEKSGPGSLVFTCVYLGLKARFFDQVK